MSEIKLTATNGSELANAIYRIRYLTDPDTLDFLFDEFQSQGMPMGSDRWAEHCLIRLRELKAKEITLNRILNAKAEMDQAIKRCGSGLQVEKRGQITKEFQKRKAREEAESAMTIIKE